MIWESKLFISKHSFLKVLKVLWLSFPAVAVQHCGFTCRTHPSAVIDCESVISSPQPAEEWECIFTWELFWNFLYSRRCKAEGCSVWTWLLQCVALHEEPGTGRRALLTSLFCWNDDWVRSTAERQNRTNRNRKMNRIGVKMRKWNMICWSLKVLSRSKCVSRSVCTGWELDNVKNKKMLRKRWNWTRGFCSKYKRKDTVTLLILDVKCLILARRKSHPINF